MQTTPKQTESTVTYLSDNLCAKGYWREVELDGLLDWLPVVRPLIQKALAAGDTSFTERAVVTALLAGQWQLWIYGEPGLAPQSICITEIIEFPKMRKLWMRYGAGNIWAFIEGFGLLESYARSRGCARIEGHMRKGWLKKFPPDYKAERVIMSKDLD